MNIYKYTSMPLHSFDNDGYYYYLGEINTFSAIPVLIGQKQIDYLDWLAIYRYLEESNLNERSVN
jgi:hypothetical protein